jgi:hypothetical protein
MSRRRRRRPTSRGRRRTCRVRLCHACKARAPSDRCGPSSRARRRNRRGTPCRGRRNRAAARACRTLRRSSAGRRSSGRNRCGRDRCRAPRPTHSGVRFRQPFAEPGPQGREAAPAPQEERRVPRRVRTSQRRPLAPRSMQRPGRQGAAWRHHSPSPTSLTGSFARRKIKSNPNVRVSARGAAPHRALSAPVRSPIRRR